MLNEIEDGELSAAIQELVRLFRANDRGSTTEAVLRLRALLEISEGVRTADLMLAAAALKRVQDAGELQSTLEALLATPSRAMTG